MWPFDKVVCKSLQRVNPGFSRHAGWSWCLKHRNMFRKLKSIAVFLKIIVTYSIPTFFLMTILNNSINEFTVKRCRFSCVQQHTVSQILGINIIHPQITWFTRCPKHNLNMSFIHAVRNYKLFVNIFSDRQNVSFSSLNSFVYIVRLRRQKIYYVKSV